MAISSRYWAITRIPVRGCLPSSRRIVCSVSQGLGEQDVKIGAVAFFTTCSMAPAPLARALDERGFESLWVPEHTHTPSSRRSDYPASGGLVQAYYELMDP